ncbi:MULTISPECIES: error-prone DNA polymerase [unclassified Pedobacter]|uniref:error-prone DNA polymerase n=1 Tax=unclassified Pedobacter TaxID=2628915 RepID=UPI001D39EF76|nr:MULTISPECIES: error-prone DNA polymerase [unclassified Pedobacter]CAH0265901.1 Error-prone DNA polymerase [Pedobacter sp. Bi36]CAH0292251.1 Error-prone DNA polymerase [Pedobacter sp. Bi126]
MGYSELQVTSNFSFLRGASHPHELLDQAAAFGYKKIAITDRNTLAGIVRAHAAAREKDISIIPACRLDLLDGPSLLAYPTDREAYGRLSALLTLGNMRAEKGSCHLSRADVYSYSTGMIFTAVMPGILNRHFSFEDSFIAAIAEYREALGNGLYLGATRSYLGNDDKLIFRISQLSEFYGIPVVATGDVHYHDPSRRELQDVLTCVREKCTIEEAGFRLHQNAERYMKPVDEMKRLFRRYPEAIKNTLVISEACTFSLDELKYVYPEEINKSGRPPLEELEYLTWKGAHEFYGEIIPEKVVNMVRYEMEFVKKMDYANYFLFVEDIVREARSRGILCQGRGSAANSAICFCLGVTSVNPMKFELLFERFISPARNEPPDIDVDFEHERREEIIQYIYDKYGRDRAAIVATVTQQHQKGAIRDVGKAMGLSVDTVNRLSGSLWEYTDEWFEGKRVTEQGLNPEDPHLKKTLELTAQMMGFPRQLGQHTGGFVVTQGKLTDLCPILNARMEDRTNIEWNKDDIDALGFLKVDVLALGMLTCIRKAFDLCRDHYGKELTLANIPQDDPDVYNMISAADTLGVFQIESRAQMSMLPRLRPKCFYDLVIEVAIVRPGPIQGDMVHPYLRRRNGEEPIVYPSPELEEILGRTLGVPLFQEQAMKIAIVAAGFTPAEADGLRRSMATFKFKGLVNQYEQKLIDGMLGKGYTLEFAKRIFKQLEGFGSYGFPESHAASFALLVYVSCWLKHYYPDAFATALLNSMPMGFYQPAQIVIDAQKHTVEVREVDVNYSSWTNLLEEKSGKYFAMRLGFRQIKGIREEEMEVLVSCRANGYRSITTLRDVGISLATLERLADADAFRSMGLDRRKALWEVSALQDMPVELFKGQPSETVLETQVELPLMGKGEHVVQDYATVGLSLKAHPVSFVRDQLEMLRIRSCFAINNEATDGQLVKVAGLVLVRQRPGTAGGVCFITIEDETGYSNLVVFEKLFETYRKEILHSRLLMVEGRLQREGQVVHVIVSKCFDFTKMLGKLLQREADDLPILTLSRSDEKTAPYPAQNKRSQVRNDVNKEAKDAFHGGRNFK